AKEVRMSGAIQFRARFECESPFRIGVGPMLDPNAWDKLAMEFENIEQAVLFGERLADAIRDHRINNFRAYVESISDAQRLQDYKESRLRMVGAATTLMQNPERGDIVAIEVSASGGRGGRIVVGQYVFDEGEAVHLAALIQMAVRKSQPTQLSGPIQYPVEVGGTPDVRPAQSDPRIERVARDQPLLERISRTIYERVHQDMGTASMCWDNPGGAGVFRAEDASALAFNLCHFIADEIERNLAQSAVNIALAAERGEFTKFNATVGAEPQKTFLDWWKEQEPKAVDMRAVELILASTIDMHPLLAAQSLLTPSDFSGLSVPSEPEADPPGSTWRTRERLFP
ncbi:MAG TPA: hypothetical protein VG815_18115, partial [Chloroflexota bacterium]|nr:hypothetical protein [Chloroflexota bacterium]